MYRKYTTSKTHIINTHNYLVQGQAKDDQQGALFHQIVITGQYAPLLLNERHLQNYISQNENQNVISQKREGFQTYFEGNVVQIKIKPGLRPITEITQLEFSDILDILDALNLDYALAVKQIKANSKHKQRQSLNNCCKFYENLLVSQETNQTILPFLQVQSHRVHYYDIYFGSVFPKAGSQRFTKSQLTSPKSQMTPTKKSKVTHGLGVTSKINEVTFLSEQASFKRYLFFLAILFSAEQPNEIAHNLKYSLKQANFRQQLKLRIDKLSKKTKQIPLSIIIQLLLRYLDKPEDYNIYILQRQCESLKEKYLKFKDNNIYEVKSSEVKKQSFRAKSMITPKSSKYLQILPQEQKPVKQLKRSVGRQINSKSEINSLKNIDLKLLTHVKKIKKTNADIFKKPKVQQPNQPSTIVQQTIKNVKKEQPSNSNQGGVGSTGKSVHLRKMSFNSSNWLNYSTIKESQLSAKLRNFKKGINVTSAHNSPQKQNKRYSKQCIQDVIPQQAQDQKQKTTYIPNQSKAILSKKQQNYSYAKRQSKQHIQDHSTQSELREQKTYHQIPSMLKKQSIETKQESAKKESIKLRSSKFLIETAKSIKPQPIVQQSQKIFYKKHFQVVLTFFKQHLSKISTTPHFSNLVYLINILYYKTMIQNFKSQSISKYRPFIESILKRQLKISEQMKEVYLILKVDMEEMYQTSKKMIQLQNSLNKGLSIQKILKELHIQPEISWFLQLTEQACLLIDEILAQIYDYIQVNKTKLVDKGVLGIMLQLGFLITVTRILCGQRLSYYKNARQGNSENLLSAFTFEFKKKEDEYLLQYQRKLADKDMSSFNISQEFDQLQTWIGQFV